MTDQRVRPRSDLTGLSRPPVGRGYRWQATHQRILDAAETVFSDGGYAAATVDAITRAAGTTRATFYKHFPGKAAIVEELVIQEREALDPLWGRLHELPEEPELSDLKAWLRVAADQWQRHAVRARIFDQASHAEPELALRAQFIAADTAGRLVRALAHLVWQDEDQALVECLLIAAQMRQAFSYWTARPPEDRDPRILDALAENWYLAIQRGRGTPRGTPGPAH